MNAGKAITSFIARNGQRVVLRTPKWEDLDDFLALINALVDEKAEITRAGNFKGGGTSSRNGFQGFDAYGFCKQHFEEGKYIDQVITVRLLE